MKKIQHRKRYLKKQKAETSSKDNELDLLGEGDGDSFTGSNADLESAADNLFTSPPHPQPLVFSSLSLKTPAKSVPPTPGTALQQKIQTNLEKSLGDSLNISTLNFTAAFAKTSSCNASLEKCQHSIKSNCQKDQVSDSKRCQS